VYYEVYEHVDHKIPVDYFALLSTIRILERELEKHCAASAFMHSQYYLAFCVGGPP
jgi:hypothetical protein